MNEKINVILAAQRAADGLTRTLASVLMQANVPFAATVVAPEEIALPFAATVVAPEEIALPFAATVVAPEEIALPFAAENARLLRGQGDLLALWRAGLEACEGEWALLLHAGDALFDAYSLWRLADARRENPQAAAVYGAARCFGPDGREARGVDFRALPCGVLARRETLLTALARAKTPFALAASLFAAVSGLRAGRPLRAGRNAGGARKMQRVFQSRVAAARRRYPARSALRLLRRNDGRGHAYRPRSRKRLRPLSHVCGYSAHGMRLKSEPEYAIIRT